MTFRATPGGSVRKPGRMVKSGTASSPVLGPELVTNGSFAASGSGWTVTGADTTHIATFNGSTLRYQSDTTSPQLSVSQTLALVVGVTYQFTFVVSAFTSGTMKADTAPGMTFTGIGTYTFIRQAVNNNLNLTRATTNVDMTLDSVSVRRIF